MAVTVIGKDNTQVKQASCNNCAALLEYTNSDVFIHRYTACGSPEADNAIQCPACQKIIFVN